MSEKEWVASFVARLEVAFASHALPSVTIKVTPGQKLPYACSIDEYQSDGAAMMNHSSVYETDILISDVFETGGWIPRIVVECKLGGITTHDALTYSAKAATHKQIHPYLRYGFLAGSQDGIPVRLVKHGAYFDFMATWQKEEPSASEWKFLLETLGSEILVSRELQMLLKSSRSRERIKYQGMHRPLKFTRQ
jgi:hypothetical protein